MQARPGSFVLLGVETTPSLSGLCQTQGLQETYRKERREKQKNKGDGWGD